MAEPGRLIGSGRAADVYDLGGGRVLRRYRTSPAVTDVEREVAVMAHVRTHGYPAPEVFDVDGTDLVMERIVGVTMVDDLAARPWRVRRHADTWADLHRRLRDVPVGALATSIEPRFGPPDGVIHLDFHPLNIMLTGDGPVVFDWTNAALGPPAADVALGVGDRGDLDGRGAAVAAADRVGPAPSARRPLRRPLRPRRRDRPAARRRRLPAGRPQHAARGGRARAAARRLAGLTCRQPWASDM